MLKKIKQRNIVLITYHWVATVILYLVTLVIMITSYVWTGGVWSLLSLWYYHNKKYLWLIR
ncbi:hypothetical protein [Spiroplasma endosymbiont of Polydrusus formosus]|uniref:hypothetical protein n=1 Tax=Spiroplasma endosymbiont of Polydrusus formosus TaxID=3139326 RepID=UPI0035B56B2C